MVPNQFDHMKNTDAYALMHGNIVNSERTADYISHVSGEQEVEFSEDPSELRVHGENLRSVTVSGYRRDFSHIMSDDILPGDWDYGSMTEMLEEQYPGTENRGALNIKREDGSEISAVLVPMNNEETNFYEETELGYHLGEIDPESTNTSVDLPIVTAVSHNTGDAEPIAEYVKDCMES